MENNRLDIQEVYQSLVDTHEHPGDIRLAHVLFENSRRQNISDDARVFILGVTANSKTDICSGPQAFRRAFGSLVTFGGAERIYDMGDVICGDKAGCVSIAAQVRELCQKFPDALILVVGESQSHVRAEVEGVILGYPDASIGVCHLDPYLDGGWELQGESWHSPFQELWEIYGDRIGYHLGFGAQAPFVNQELLTYLTSKRFKPVYLSKMYTVAEQEQLFHQELDVLFSTTDHVCVNMDLSVLRGTSVPTVSTPMPVGLMPEAVLPVLTRFAQNPFFRTLGFYGVPQTDQKHDGAALLSALMAYHVCKSRVISKYVPKKGNTE